MAAEKLAGLRIETLGASRIYRGPLDLQIAPDREFGLLLWLAWQAGRPTPIDRLLSLFWHRSPAGRARRSLNQLVWQLRRKVANLHIHRSTGAISVAASAVHVDAVGLLGLAAEGQWVAVRQAYTGRFLEDRDLDFSSAMEQWVEDRRRETVGAFTVACGHIIDSALADGNWTLVSRCISELRTASEDPRALEQLELRVTALAGDNRGAANLAISIHGSLSKRKLANPISLSALREAEPLSGSMRPIDQAPPFVGRSREFRALAGALGSCRSHQVQAVIVRGEGGIGKTRLAMHFLRYAAIQGARILLASPRHAQRFAPYGTVAELLRSGVRPTDFAATRECWWPALQWLVPDIAPHCEVGIPDEAPSHQIAAALADLLRGVSSKSPLVLFVDDLQWIDERSATQLDYVMQNCAEQPLLLVGCLNPIDLRRGSAGRLVRDWAEDGICSVVDLGEIDRDVAWELFDGLESVTAKRISAPLRERIFNATGGRPFFLIELAKAESDASAGERSGTHKTLPSTIETALLARFATLTKTGQDILRVLALIDRDAEFEFLLGLVDCPRWVGYKSLSELVIAGLVVERGTSICIAHHLVREAAYGTMNAVERRALHSRVALALDSSGNGSAAELAIHYASADDHERAFANHLRAARDSLENEALGDALMFVECALQHAFTQDQVNGANALRIEVSLARRHFGDLGCVVRASGGVRESSTRAAASTRRDVLQVFVDVGEGMRSMEELLGEAVRIVDSNASRLRAIDYAELLRLIAGSAHGVRTERFWIAFVDQLVHRGMDIDDNEAGAVILSAGACVQAAHLDVIPAYETARAGIRRAELSHRKIAIVRSRAALGTVCLLGARLDEAESSLLSAVALSRDCGLVGPGVAARNNYAIVEMERGRWKSAASMLEEDVRHAAGYESLFLRGNLALCYLETGAISQASQVAVSLLKDGTGLGADWATAASSAVLFGCSSMSGDAQATRSWGSHLERVLSKPERGTVEDPFAEIAFATHMLGSGRVTEAAKRLAPLIESARKTNRLALIKLRIAQGLIAASEHRSPGRAIIDEARHDALLVGANGVVAVAERVLRAVDSRRSPVGAWLASGVEPQL